MVTEQEIIALLKPDCICKGIKLYRIIEAIAAGADCFEKVSRTTGIGEGSCNSKRCGEKVARLLADKKATRKRKRGRLKRSKS